VEDRCSLYLDESKKKLKQNNQDKKWKATTDQVDELKKKKLGLDISSLDISHDALLT